MPPSTSGLHSTHPSHELDKINLLFYSSATAFILMSPIWMYYDLPIFLSASPSPVHPTKGYYSTTARHRSVPANFLLNGTVHFAQSILAFVLLSSTSPVTYSIASLIKRVAVICIAIMWFQQNVHAVQAFGITLTFVGLWMYNSANGDGSVERGERKRGRVERALQGVLPSNMEQANFDWTSPAESKPLPLGADTSGTVSASAYSRPRGSTINSMPLHSYIQTHQSPPSLHIKITAPTPSKSTHHTRPNGSPMNSYPSPPPSLDSPPERIITLPLEPLSARA